MNEPRKPITDDDLNQLFARARLLRPETSRAEYAFETRLLAGLKDEQRNSLGLWGWRLAPWFAAGVMALGLFSWSAILEHSVPFSDSPADWLVVQLLVVS